MLVLRERARNHFGSEAIVLSTELASWLQPTSGGISAAALSRVGKLPLLQFVRAFLYFL